MQFAGAVVVLAAAFPHAEVRRPVRSLDVEHKVLYKVHLVRREDYLHRQRFTYSVLGAYQIAIVKILQEPDSTGYQINYPTENRTVYIDTRAATNVRTSHSALQLHAQICEAGTPVYNVRSLHYVHCGHYLV